MGDDDQEMSFARDVADRIVFMDAGVIVEEGKPDQAALRAADRAPRPGRPWLQPRAPGQRTA
jgi:ABC-type histidine transport system ATPase subunit